MESLPQITTLATDENGQELKLLTDEVGNLLMLGREVIKLDQDGLLKIAQSFIDAAEVAQ